MNTPPCLRAVALVVVGLFVGAFRASAAGVGAGVPGTDAIPVPSPSAAPSLKFGKIYSGDPAPDFTVSDAVGRDVKLSDFKGKVVVLGFWTTRRGPSPELSAVAARYADQGLVVLAVCADADRATFDAWRAKNSAGETGCTIAWDPAGKAADASVAGKKFGLGSFPSTGVIDRKGEVVGGFTGFGSRSGGVLGGFLRTAGLKLTESDAAMADAEAGVAAPPAAAAPPPESKTLKAGEVAPDFGTIDAAGAPVKLSDFKGRIVVVDFWATWCGPCIASLPHTQVVAKKFHDAGVVVFAACTWDTRAKFEGWLKLNRAEYPDLVFAHEPGGSNQAECASSKLYGVRGIPMRFVIDRDGKIAAAIGGYGEGDRRIEAALAKLGVPVDPEVAAQGEAQLKQP